MDLNSSISMLPLARAQSAEPSNSTKPPKREPMAEIIYALALPDWAPNEVTPFQGFAPGLISLVPAMDVIPELPADILELTMDPADRLARRRAGEGSWLWTPVNLSTLMAKRSPKPLQPFMVVFSGDKATAKAISKWRRNLRIRPLHVSFHDVGGSLHPAELTADRLKRYCKAALRQARQADKRLDISGRLEALERWEEVERRPFSLKYHSHNVTKPNEMVLVSAGEEGAQEDEGHLSASPSEHYIQGISDSARAVIDLWPQTEDRTAHLMNPIRPDVFLVAPAMVRNVLKKLEHALPDRSLLPALRALDRQQGYTMQLELEEDQVDRVGPFLSMRGAETKILTTAVGLRAASTVAATIRLPPAVTRAAGVVGQLSRFLRTHENPPATKAARVFRVVQDALLETVPSEHLDLISRSKSGIKIIADAPLEWLPVDGLPLGIRFDVSRINATPGNLFLQQIRCPITQYIPPDAFRDCLVLSMFEDGDGIAYHLRLGLALAGDGSDSRMRTRYASPNTVDEFVDAVNAFHGPILIIDSHGAHEDGDGPGGIIIGGESVDVWKLVDRIRMPPIVLLSACDTHPFDRSHATVANGFLACGATSVIGTALPIRAAQAARFAMRIINRAIHFADIVNGMGRSVPWTHVFGGVLRMELATDILRGISEQGFYDQEKMSELLLATNIDLNPLRDDWFERLAGRVIAECGFDDATWRKLTADLIASSDAIRYLHLGNPESILVSGPSVARGMMKRFAKVAALTEAEGNAA